MKKKLLLIIALILVTSSLVLANSGKTYIYDQAGLLTLEQKKDLENLARDYSQKRKTDILILTTDSQDFYDAESYMDYMYESQALGYQGYHGDAVILTLNMATRDVYVSGHEGAMERMDNRRTDSLRRKILDDLSSGDFYRAFKIFIESSNKYLGIRPGINPEGPIFKLWFRLILSLASASIVLGAMLYRTEGRRTVNESSYKDSKKSRLVDSYDRYIRTSISKSYSPRNQGNNSGGSSGGTTSGGSSYSGSGSKF